MDPKFYPTSELANLNKSPNMLHIMARCINQNILAHMTKYKSSNHEKRGGKVRGLMYCAWHESARPWHGLSGPWIQAHVHHFYHFFPYISSSFFEYTILLSSSNAIFSVLFSREELDSILECFFWAVKRFISWMLLFSFPIKRVQFINVGMHILSCEKINIFVESYSEGRPRAWVGCD